MENSFNIKVNLTLKSWFFLTFKAISTVRHMTEKNIVLINHHTQKKKEKETQK